MIETFLYLLGFQFLGEVLARLAGLPVPGAVIGMVLLFVWLCIRKGVPAPMREHVPNLMTHMSLLFIPAGVGVMAYWPQLSQYSWKMVVVLLVATLGTLLASAGFMCCYLYLRPVKVKHHD